MIPPKFPWMKFYPSDHSSDPKLKMCSLAARGLWVEMLGLMHSAVPYGYLLMNGAPITEKQLAAICGAKEREVSRLVAELSKWGVFSRTSEGVIFSRRMVRDYEKGQAARTFGKLGGNPSLKPRVNPRDKGSLKPQTPEAKGQNSAVKEKIHIKEGSPQWKAWTEYRGRPFPLDKKFGWFADSEWPPGYEPTLVQTTVERTRH